MKLFLSHLVIVFLLFSCGETVVEEEGSGSSTDSGSGPRSAQLYTGDIVAKQGIEFTQNSSSFFGTNVSAGYTFSLVNNPSFLSIDTNTGVLSGTSDYPGLFQDIVVRATNIANNAITVDSSNIDIAVNGDPLRRYAWHINNTGQKAFSSVAGSAGFDLNVEDVWAEGIFGDGVTVAISDSGVEINHDDLYNNQISNSHRDYSLNSPYIANPTPTNFHGTAVTGIVSAVGYNNFGSIGIAPSSKFGGFQFLDSPQTTAIMVHQAQGNFDIFNYSYGDYVFEDTQSDATYLDQLRYQTITEDKVFVKAAGNEFISLDVNGICASHNANFPFENESPHLIIVGAIHADGAKSSYSNAGSNLWVVAPGGEDGEGFGPAIISADLRTCFKGQSIAGTFSSNDLEYNHPLNIQCDYTAVMNGTSSATPNVAGVIALMREVNGNLKMRDIKHIFASTSVQVDPTFSAALNYYGTTHPENASSSCTTNLDLTGHTYEQGWITNNAGYVFSNFYGFGLVDAKAAVDAAKVYAFPLGNQVELNQNFNSVTYRSTPAAAIPDADATGVSDTITISNGTNLTVESVQVKVQISHPRSGQIGVELTSPGTTKSILMNINNSFLYENDSNLNITLTSNAFYGETLNGNWTIKIIDGRSGSTGTLTQWDINVLGH